MNITTYRYPFEHVVVDGFLPSDVHDSIYYHCLSVEESDLDFTRPVNGAPTLQDNIEIVRNSRNFDPLAIDNHQELVTNAFDRVSRLFVNSYEPENRGWLTMVTETNRNYSNSLVPHTDDPVEMRERGLDDATLKGILYIADKFTVYPHYGTKIYFDSNRGNYIKEVDYVANRLLMFKTSNNSWHGTDFIKGLPNRRFFITGMYNKLSK